MYTWLFYRALRFIPISVLFLSYAIFSIMNYSYYLQKKFLQLNLFLLFQISNAVVSLSVFNVQLSCLNDKLIINLIG